MNAKFLASLYDTDWDLSSKDFIRPNWQLARVVEIKIVQQIDGCVDGQVSKEGPKLAQ